MILEGDFMFNKDIKVFKNYDINNDMMEIYEFQMCVSLFLEKSGKFMRFVYENCNEDQMEDLDVEILELRDYFTEFFYLMTNNNKTIILPNSFYYDSLHLKKGNDIKLINKFIKTLQKVNKLNSKSVTKAGYEYNI